MTRIPRTALLASAAVVALGMAPAAAYAQSAKGGATEVQELVVTGSRFGPRVVTQSPTPIDSISNAELAKAGAPDLQGALKVLTPSFNTPRPATAGASDFLLSPTLRGLSTGELLLLVNGKRRHTNADLNTNQQIGRGDVSYDFNAIPVAAIGHVEVLRDGAAAQYGSDAIAGVINLQLDDSLGFRATGRVGETAQGDGKDAQFSIANGFAIGNDGGFARITGSYQYQGKTNRALPDTRQQYFGSVNGNPVVPSGNYGSGVGLTPSNGALDPREATIDRNTFVFGQPSFHNAAVFLNSQLPLTSDITAYAFGGYNRLSGVSYNFYRIAANDATIRSLYPNGFMPLAPIVFENASMVVGVKGKDLLGFRWDLSTDYGKSRNHYFYTNTDNASLGAASPTSFDRGRQSFTQWTTNLDLTREFPVGDGDPLKLALGLEYRYENYTLTPGDLASYLNGGQPILDGPNAGKPAPVGAQPSGGFTPLDAADADRHSTAEYVELEKTFADRLLLDAAVRHEDYSDFGATTDFKLAGRLSLMEGLALRASAGTGFRAPALAQSYFSSTNVNFVNGEPLNVRFVSVHAPLASLVGASPLKPEKSKDASVGAVFHRGPFAATIDAYQIKLRDRIVISSTFKSNALTSFLAASGQPGINSVAFMTNAVDTTTRGVDVTATWRQNMEDYGVLAATFAANFNHTHIDRIAGTPAALGALGITTPLFDLTSQVRLQDGTPKDKESLTLGWTREKWSVTLVNTRYGEVSEVALTGRTPAQVAALIPGYSVTLLPAAPGSVNSDIIQHFRADIVTDLDVSYEATDHVTVSVGATNLFDKYPERQIASTVASVAAGTNGADNAGIFPYAYIAPYGTNGRFVYFKADYRF
ncbi:MAG: TonB-dependent receptor [Alphaproteobacteria bacterium]|nr:TonB-dependent receptor [Alphaproteobacteria bacterium]